MYRKSLFLALLCLCAFDSKAGVKRFLKKVVRVFRKPRVVYVSQPHSDELNGVMYLGTEESFSDESSTFSSRSFNGNVLSDTQDAEVIEIRGVSADGKHVIMRISSSSSNISTVR